MSQWMFILGHNPALSAEELLAVLAPSTAEIIDCTPNCLILEAEVNPGQLMGRLGGTIKIAEVLEILPSLKDWTADNWKQTLLVADPSLESGTSKMMFGFSQHGFSSLVKQLTASGLQAKKDWQQQGVRSRFLANPAGDLSSVVIAKNKLLNHELIFVKGSKQVFIGVTRAVQNFAAYGKRDYGRPERDSWRGMVPPKLAQIMINLADVSAKDAILDPFCGVGTILQEAGVMGYKRLIGTDSDQEVITQAGHNITWLNQRFPDIRVQLEVVKAQQLVQHFGPESFQAIITEPYLGPARELQRPISPGRLRQIMSELSALYLEAFRQFFLLLDDMGSVVMVWPVFRASGQEQILPLVYPVTQLGFKLQKPRVAALHLATKLSSRGTLIYQRPDQNVAREITVWTKT